MQRIKEIALKTLQLGFIEESEDILYNLLEAQTKEMGLLHEDTLETVLLLGHALAQGQHWDKLQKLYNLLSVLQDPSLPNFDSLHHTQLQLESLQQKAS